MKEKTEKEKIEAEHMKLIVSELRMFGAPIPAPEKEPDEVNDQYTANTLGAK